MIILGIDTSCEQASCSVYIEGVVKERRTGIDKRKHSETLMPMVDSFLKEEGLEITDINSFAVSAGPGSFTGLRIGMAAVKGLAYAQGKKITVIKTLDVLANYFPVGSETVCPVIDARNNQVYTAVYKEEDGYYKPATDYIGIKIEELADILKQYNKIVLCGDASLKHYEFFISNGVNCQKPNPGFLYPSAGILVRLAAAGFGQEVEVSEAVPFYLRVSQAERFHGSK